MSFNIAIDGPAGAGKSTIAKRVAKELGFVYADTGALYRAIARYLLTHGILASDDDAVKEACQEIKIDIEYLGGEQQVILNGENVTGQLRTEAVGNMASASAANYHVRETLLGLQRDLAGKVDILMDGRDIGTNVLPDAQLKIYLTASAGTRAKRRYLELQEKGVACRLDEIEQAIRTRDEQDMNRAIAPLKQADDAYLLDSSDMTIDEVVEKITTLYRSVITE